ncbi:MAG: hypothetical protein K0R18_1966 [Bacillales bacterium]|nr:hypothetical protein [Bacillales bacterium]
MIIFTLEIFAIAVFAGCFGSMVGLGGGIIVTPALTILFGIDMKYAIGASIISVIATSSGSAIAYLKENLANIRIAMFLEIGTAIGAITGAFLAGLFSTSMLYIVFGLFLLYSSWNMLQTLRKSGGFDHHVETSHPLAEKLQLGGSYFDKAIGEHKEYKVAGVYGSLIAMFFAGITSGLLGIGAGGFKVLSMDVFMKLPMKVSTATSNFMIGVTAAASAAIYFFRGDIDPKITAPVALGVLAGSIVGARVMQKLPNKTIRLIFIPVITFISIQMIWKGIF